MKFTSIPEAYSSFRESLTYAFDTESAAHDVEVQIIDATTNEVIALKRLYGISAGEIDIAPYLERRVRPTLPSKVEQSGAIDPQQSVKVKVAVEGTESATRTFITAKIDCEKPFQSLMTQIGQRTMACDEFDIITWFAQPGVAVEVVVEAFGKGNETLTITPAGEGVQAVAVTPLDFMNIPAEMRVSVRANGETECVVHYDIKPNLRGARRVAWLNRHLAAELYTFPLRKSVLVKSARKCMESIWGKEASSLECENELKLLSAYEPQAQIEALAEILAAKHLWLVEGGVPQRIDLLTERVMAAKCGEMGMVELDIRAAEEGVRLW